MRFWFDKKEGEFGFIAVGWVFNLKAPWAFAYFSERYGYEKWHRVFGWRWQFRRMR